MWKNSEVGLRSRRAAATSKSIQAESNTTGVTSVVWSEMPVGTQSAGFSDNYPGGDGPDSHAENVPSMAEDICATGSETAALTPTIQAGFSDNNPGMS